MPRGDCPSMLDFDRREPFTFYDCPPFTSFYLIVLIAEDRWSCLFIPTYNFVFIFFCFCTLLFCLFTSLALMQNFRYCHLFGNYKWSCNKKCNDIIIYNLFPVKKKRYTNEKHQHSRLTFYIFLTYKSVQNTYNIKMCAKHFTQNINHLSNEIAFIYFYLYSNKL